MLNDDIFLQNRGNETSHERGNGGNEGGKRGIVVQKGKRFLELVTRTSTRMGTSGVIRSPNPCT